MRKMQFVTRLKQLVRHLIVYKPYSQVIYSQEGEDLQLQRIFESQKTGFYVDVGAHHPHRYSNTYWAYRRGWSGLNIDATPGFATDFARKRPRDVNVQCCISDRIGESSFYVFPEQALNTANKERELRVHELTGNSAQVIGVRTSTLAKVLDDQVPKNITIIDFMSIDVEGGEMAVLRGNDWQKYKPRVLVMEVLDLTLLNIKESPEVKFLEAIGFIPVAMLYHSIVFVSDKNLLKAHWTNGHGDEL